MKVKFKKVFMYTEIRGKKMEKNKISINEKYAVSISELSLLLGIGEHTIRKYLSQTDEFAEYIIFVGSTIRIKRQKFINYLDTHHIQM